MTDLTLEEVEALKYGMSHDEAWQCRAQLAKVMRRNVELESLWFPICDYLQDHPEKVGARLGDCISKKLLQHLKDT